MRETSASRKAALWIGLVFLLGAALGGIIGYAFAQRSSAASFSHMSDQAKRQRKVDRLTKEVGLTPEQQKQLDAILAETQEQYKAIHKQTEPQIDEARQNGRNRVRAILTPEQKPKFEDFLKRLDEEKKRNGR